MTHNVSLFVLRRAFNHDPLSRCTWESNGCDGKISASMWKMSTSKTNDPFWQQPPCCRTSIVDLCPALRTPCCTLPVTSKEWRSLITRCIHQYRQNLVGRGRLLLLRLVAHQVDLSCQIIELVTVTTTMTAPVIGSNASPQQLVRHGSIGSEIMMNPALSESQNIKGKDWMSLCCFVARTFRFW